MKSFNWLLVLSVLSCIGCSSPVHEDGRGCAFVSDSIQYRVEFMSAGCVRILSFPEGDTLVTRRLVVDSEKPAFKDYKWEDTGQKLLFRTRELSVVFDKADAAFTFQETSTGKLLLKEKGIERHGTSNVRLPEVNNVSKSLNALFLPRMRPFTDWDSIRMES